MNSVNLMAAFVVIYMGDYEYWLFMDFKSGVIIVRFWHLLSWPSRFFYRLEINCITIVLYLMSPHTIREVKPYTLSDNISADKIFGTNSIFRHFCPPKMFDINLIWFDGTENILNFSWQNISADKIFGTNSKFRHFCPPKMFISFMF